MTTYNWHKLTLTLIAIGIFMTVSCKRDTPVIEFEKFVYEAGNSDDINIPDAELVTISGLILEVNHIERPSQPLSMAFDGLMSTKYHSPWATDIPPTEFPVIIDVTLPDDAPSFEYMLYWPRQEGTNGRILSWEVRITTKSDPDNFITILDTEYAGDNSAKKIDIPGEYVSDIKRIQFYITEGLADVIAIQEIEFYNAAPILDIPGIFTDSSCSELKEGVSRDEIEEIDNSVYRNIALALFDGTYDTRRVRTYKSIARPEIMAEINKTSTYSLLDNATGIYINEGDDLIFMVDGLNSAASIKIMDHDIEGSEGWNGQTVRINDGVNKISSSYSGLVYIMFNNSDNESIKVNFASGLVNGIYDIVNPGPESWNELLNNASATRMDMLGEYSHLIFPVNDLREYTSNPDRLLEVYDSIVLLEQQFLGLYKYDRLNKSRMLFRCTPSASYMHATAYRTEYNPSTMDRLCDFNKLRTSDIWGPAHEVGHVNQTRPGFRWKNSDGISVLGEVSNNVYSMHVQRTFGNSSRLEEDNSYEASWNTFMVQNIKHMDAVGAVDKKYFWHQLVHLWQLELYFSDVLGQKDFYKDLHEEIRISPDPVPATEHHAFAYLASKVSGYDLSFFFNRYGYDLDQSTVDKITSLGYSTPDQPLWYITDSNTGLFKERKAPTNGNAVMVNNGDTYYFMMNGWADVLAYEVKVDGVLKYISRQNNFTITLPQGTIDVDAIGADGSTTSVSFQ